MFLCMQVDQEWFAKSPPSEVPLAAADWYMPRRGFLHITEKKNAACSSSRSMYVVTIEKKQWEAMMQWLGIGLGSNAVDW